MTKDSALSPRSRGDSAIVASALLLYLCAVLPLGSLADANASFSAAFCPDGWNLAPNRNKCFIRLANSLPWNDSEALCGQFGGHLASLQSPEDLTFAQSLCTDDKDGCWIGGHGRSSNSGYVWNWSDDFALWNGSIFTVEPSHSQATDLCTLLTRGKNTTVAGENCNASHSSICATERESKCYRNHCHREYLIVIAVVSLLILTTALVVVVWLLLYKRSKRHRRSRKASSPAAAALVPPSWRVFSSEEVRAMTKNFSEGNRLAGDAKTGGTYGGVLADGTKVAVKRLRKSRLQRKKEFFAEVARVVKLHHPNLIGVKGCCYDHGDRYIVYEFIGNGSLDRWLHHGARGGKSLDWGARMKIATTLARAIAFLHDKVKPQVVHRDVRASNVLLDEEFGAHLMGVGLSKFVYWEVMHERTKVAGSAGYLAPEFMYQNELTTKSDVFSFGVLLLEIVSGRRPAQVADAVGGPSILHWATPLVQAHRYMDLLDPLILARPDPGTVHKVVDLVYACTQIVPSVRPRMSHVVHQLQQISATTVAAAASASASASATSASPASSSSMLPLEVVMGPP